MLVSCFLISDVRAYAESTVQFSTNRLKGLFSYPIYRFMDGISLRPLMSPSLLSPCGQTDFHTWLVRVGIEMFETIVKHSTFISWISQPC
ncbi:hypothetical protein SprV_0301320400 [Sparganum proliferum]